MGYPQGCATVKSILGRHASVVYNIPASVVFVKRLAVFKSRQDLWVLFDRLLLWHDECIRRYVLRAATWNGETLRITSIGAGWSSSDGPVLSVGANPTPFTRSAPQSPRSISHRPAPDPRISLSDRQ